MDMRHKRLSPRAHESATNHEEETTEQGHSAEKEVGKRMAYRQAQVAVRCDLSDTGVLSASGEQMKWGTASDGAHDVIRIPDSVAKVLLRSIGAPYYELFEVITNRKGQLWAVGMIDSEPVGGWDSLK